MGMDSKRCWSVIALVAVTMGTLGCGPAATPALAREQADSDAALAADGDTASSADARPAAGPERDKVKVRRGNPPFTRRIDVPDFPPGMTWLNTKPLTKADLRGKFVLLDFWT